MAPSDSLSPDAAPPTDGARATGTATAEWLPWLLLAALTVAAYAPALPGGFIYDDFFHIKDNPGLRDPWDLRAVLFSGYQGTRPLYNLSLAANVAAFGQSTLAFHVVNLLGHLLCGWLVLRLAARLGLGRTAQGVATGIFLLHPLATESVAYINSRSGVFAAAAGLGALLLVSRPQASLASRVGAAALAIVAAGFKESAAVLPVLAWLVTRSVRRSAWLLGAPLLVPLLFAIFPTPHHHTIGSTVPDPLGHVRAEPYALLRLVQMTLVPVGQNLDHEVPLPQSWLDPWFVGPLLGVLALVAVGALALARRRWLGFGLAWFFVALAPTNSVIPFVDTLAERHAYLALVGAALLGGHAAELGWARWGRARVGAVLLALVLTATALTAARATLWRDELSMWLDAAAKSPRKGRPLLNIGTILAERGDVAAALPLFARATAIEPTLVEAHFNLGLALLRLGRPAEATAPLERTLALAPAHAAARRELARARRMVAPPPAPAPSP